MAKYKIIPSSRTIVQSPISIGHKAEKGVEAIEFDLTAWVETYGSGTLTVIMRRWGDAIPYPIALEIDENNKATWVLSDTDTARAGMACAQLSYIVGETVVKKSDIYTFRVMDSLTGEGEPPEAYESWLEHLTHLAAEAMAEVLDIEGIVTDKTLTIDGGIADAKATGEALAKKVDAADYSELSDRVGRNTIALAEKADQSTTYTKTEVDALIDEVEVETDTTLEIAGAPADAAETGRQIGLLKADLGNLNGGSVNLLNPADFQQGKYIVAGGGLSDNASLTASGFFQVNENTTYYIYRPDSGQVRVAYYTDDSDSGYIGMDSGISTSTPTFTTRAGTKWVRISANSTLMLGMGIYAENIGYYIPYHIRLAEGVSIKSQIDKDLISADKASPADVVGLIKAHVILPEKCIKFGDSGMIIDERLDMSNGKVVTNSSGQTRTDFIPVTVGDCLQTCAIRDICLYDDQYTYLGYINLWSDSGNVAPPGSYSGNYNSNIVWIEAINGVNPSYIRCWGRYDQYPPAVTMLSDEPYRVVNLGDSIFGNNEKPWDLGTYIHNITGVKDANCGYGGTTARVIPSGNMSPLGLPSIVDCIVSEDFSPLGTPAYWANLREYRYGVPTLLFGMVDFSEVEIITIAYGTNDWNSNTPLDNTDNRLDTSTYKGGLRYAVENLQTKYPDITLIMLSPIYRYWSDSSDYSTVDSDSDGRTNSLGLKLIDYVTAMEEVADEYHLPYFNNYDNIGLNRYTAPTWLRDGTHLNRGIGVDKMGHIVAREVNQIY